MHMLPLLLLFSAAASATTPTFKPPPLGFSSWNKFGMGITAPVLLEVADAFASSGLQAAGYLYLCTDDGWMDLNRSAATGLQVPTESYTNGTAFPTLRSVGDAVHAKGFKFGIYTAAGTTTCGVRAGSLFNERLDAEHYARAGVDYIKCKDLGVCPDDGCGEANLQHFLKDSAAFDAVVAAYSKTERGAIDYFSYHPWKTYVPEAIHEMPWVGTVGHLWRTTVDIRPIFESIVSNAHGNNRWAVHQKPGHYADADMLEIGNGNLTVAEQRSHFALWCLMKSPLLIGADPRLLTNESLAILTNSFLIAVNQDALGVQGTLVSSSAAAAIPAGDSAAAQHHSAAARSAGATRDATSPPIDGDESADPTFIAPCTFGALITPEQRWRISADGRLLSTQAQHGDRCLVRGSAGDSRAIVDSVGCAALRSTWDFGRANQDTLSQVRAPDNASSCLTYDGEALRMKQCRAETSDTPKAGKNCTQTTCRFSSRSDQLWYLNSLGQLGSSFTNWAPPVGSPPRVAASNIPMCLTTSGGFQPPPTPDPPAPAVNTSLPLQVWAGPLAGGDVAVVLFNAGAATSTITARWADVGLSAGVVVAATDLWTGMKVPGEKTGSIAADVGPHDVAAFRLRTTL